MRLVDLKPRWITPFSWSAPEPFYIGISFYCPHCPQDAPLYGDGRRRRLAVLFWPPIDPTDWLSRMLIPIKPTGHIRVSGETFDTITLSPSIGFEEIGHWHGHIVDGNAF